MSSTERTFRVLIRIFGCGDYSRKLCERQHYGYLVTARLKSFYNLNESGVQLPGAWLVFATAAEFLFSPSSQAQPEAARLGATLFHTAGAELARQGDLSSFEVVMQHFQLEGDPALALLGRIVNTADIKQSPYRQPEGPGCVRSPTDLGC